MLKINESWKKIMNQIFILKISITFGSIKESIYVSYIH